MFHNRILTVDFLTESDIRILNIVLAEYLPKLKKHDLNLDQDHQDNHPRVTKEEVVTCLWKIGQNEFAKILEKNNGKFVE